MRWLLAVLAVATVSAHVPEFNNAGATAETAFLLDDPQKSWVFYDSLEAGQQHWFQFRAAPGDTVFASISLPSAENARPSLWIVGPEFDADGPANPEGLGGMRVNPQDSLSVEPFSPLAMRSVAEFRQAVQGGTYYVVVDADEAVTYGLAIGARESFTPAEWATVPVERIAIQQWGGIPWPVAVAGEVLAVVLVWAIRREMSLGLAGAAAIAGTGATTSILAIIAAVQGGASGALVIPAVFAAAAVGIGVGAHRALQGPWWATLPWALAAIVFWAGLLIGPALLVAHAVSRRWPRHAGRQTASLPE